MTVRLDTTTTEARSHSGVAASAVDATKVHGKDATEVRALDGVTLDFAAGQFRPSWARPALASRRWYIASPGWTPSPQAAHSSAGST
jgi:hypothetical protein